MSEDSSTGQCSTHGPFSHSLGFRGCDKCVEEAAQKFCYVGVSDEKVHLSEIGVWPSDLPDGEEVPHSGLRVYVGADYETVYPPLLTDGDVQAVLALGASLSTPSEAKDARIARLERVLDFVYEDRAVLRERLTSRIEQLERENANLVLDLAVRGDRIDRLMVRVLQLEHDNADLARRLAAENSFAGKAEAELVSRAMPLNALKHSR